MNDVQEQVTTVAYLVSRFPKATETFVLRELDAVSRDSRLQLELTSLLAPTEPVIHAAAAPWVERLHQASLKRGAVRTLGFLFREPRRLVRVLTTLVAAHVRHPRRLAHVLAILLASADTAVTMRKLGVDRIHAHFAGNPGMAAWVIKHLVGIPFTVTTHAYDLYRDDQKFLLPVVTSASHVVTISEYNRRFLAGLGLDEDRMSVIHCGVHPDQYGYQPREIPSSGPIKVLCVASLEEYKGHEYLLDAIASSDPQVARMEVSLVGDGSRRSDLEERVRRLGFDDRVTFHGNQPEAVVAELLDAAYIFVLPSVIGSDNRMEGLPVALMESLASGVPTIATNISGVPELIRHRETGLLVEPRDAAQLRAALVEIVDDPQAAVERAARGRALVEASFDVSQSAELMASLLSRAA